MDYLLKTSAIIAIFYGFYKLILQRETFFQSNRWFLLIGILTAILVPLIVIPIYIEQTTFFTQNFSSPISNDVMILEESIDWISILKFIYFGGILFFGGKFIFDLASLGKLITSNSKEKNDNYNFIKTDKGISPFSFFNFIFFNPNQFKNKELEQIITHEKVHVQQRHSIDILISQIISITFWFNPFIWLYKKEIQQNLEFIADDLAQQNSTCEKSYQKLLLKTSLPNNQLALTNNFYNSLIKKRIIMLHKNRSKSTNQLKYLLILPLLIAFIFMFNTEIIAQNSNSKYKITHEVNEVVYEEKDNNINLNNLSFSFEINKNSTTESINKFEKILDKGILKKEFGTISTKINGIKRNSKGEITAIKITVKSKTSNTKYNTSSNEPIKPIKITIENEGNTISIKTQNNHNSYFDSDNDDLTLIIEDIDSSHKKTNTSTTVTMKGGNKKENNTLFNDLNGSVLYYINGEKSKKKDIDNLNPNDIKSMSVLKGEAAIKKYGEKAKDGVILITTKSSR